MLQLKSRRVVVTGAAGGLGTILVSTLVSRGARVAGIVKTQEDAEALMAQTGSDSLSTIVLDLEDSERIAAALEKDVSENGPVYGLVNNAAIYPNTEIAELAVEEARSVFAVNALAAAALVQACLPGMKSLEEGRIINIASNTFDMGMAKLSAYVGSKGALIGMARVWARELGPFGITVNTVSPGAFKTAAEAIHADPEAYSQFVISQQALKRRGDPVEFTQLVAFLLSDEAGFITGQNIRIDGGWVTQ